MGIAKALITGASSGIGKQLAFLLAEKGISLIVVGRNLARLEEVPHASYLQADLATKEGVELVCKVIEQELPDLVVNNAGFGFYGPLIQQEDDQESIHTNVTAVVSISKCAASTYIRHNRSGIILNVSSVLAYLPAPHATVYGACKSFVKRFSEDFDQEVRVQNVRVLCACPGQVATDFQVRAGGKKESARGMVLDPKKVAQALWDQVQKQKSVQIIDWKYRLLVGLCRFIPNWLLSKLLSRTYKLRSTYF